LEQVIVDWKTALETAITPLHAYEIWWTLVHKRRKWDLFPPIQIDFFWRSYLRS